MKHQYHGNIYKKKKKAETKKKQKRKQLSREKVGKYLKALGGKYALTVL